MPYSERAGRARRRRPHHGDADLAARSRRSRRPRPHRAARSTRAATSCARPATPTSSCATSTPRSTGCAAKHALRRVPRRRGRRDHAPQELRRHRLVRRRGPARALDLLGFASQLVFNTFHNRRLRDWEHGGDLDLAYGVARAHNRGMVEFCSVDAPAAAHLLRAARRLRPRRGDGRRGARHGRRRAAGRVGLPARPLAEPHRRSTRCGRAPGGRHPDRVPRRRHRRPASTPTTSRTACRSRPTSTAARRTSARSTTWASPARRCRRWPR